MRTFTVISVDLRRRAVRARYSLQNRRVSVLAVLELLLQWLLV